MPKAGILALLIGGKKPPIGLGKPKKKTRSNRDDLRAAVRDFTSAKDDDARVEALLSFQELSRGYEKE